MLNKNVIQFIQMLSDQGKKHNLILKKLDKDLIERVTEMTPLELIYAFQEISHTSRNQLNQMSKIGFR